MDATPARTIVVMRHGRQEQGSVDRTCRLTADGRADATRAGEWLNRVGVQPDLVLVSPAVRTVKTGELVVRALDSEHSPRVQVVNTLYGADAEGVLSEIRAGAGAAACVMVIGHNPAVSELVRLLDRDASTPYATHLAAGAVVVLETSVEWAELADSDAEVIHRHTPT